MVVFVKFSFSTTQAQSAQRYLPMSPDASRVWYQRLQGMSPRTAETPSPDKETKVVQVRRCALHTLHIALVEGGQRQTGKNPCQIPSQKPADDRIGRIDERVRSGMICMVSPGMLIWLRAPSTGRRRNRCGDLHCWSARHEQQH
jgi:hypothetical protein